ncbi:PspC domain-containing protein [Bifidobacterium sp. 82T10]|uniref:PspC domain-containing protein n=1 Tax=Bifidobacterium miconis TaxID=2834435 RepID=A0ABS6WHH4_9BIFI|nr:PspC domain-containing protein [Bifidobacterium miconis]MBW3092707.1 PspC domain-containing protein [Bifidobacterium miconis]
MSNANDFSGSSFRGDASGNAGGDPSGNAGDNPAGGSTGHASGGPQYGGPHHGPQYDPQYGDPQYGGTAGNPAGGPTGNPAGNPYAGSFGNPAFGPNPYANPAPPVSGDSAGWGSGTASGVMQRFFRWVRNSGIGRSDDRWVGGVCGGLARYFRISPVLMRAIMLAAVLVCGFGAAFYALAWFVLPDDRDGTILSERLVAGDWDWACLGVFLCFAIGVMFPGAGFVLTLLAAFVLWLLLEREMRRQRGYGGPASSSRGANPNPGNPGNGGWSGDPVHSAAGATAGSGPQRTTAAQPFADGSGRRQSSANPFTPNGAMPGPTPPVTFASVPSVPASSTAASSPAAGGTAGAAGPAFVSEGVMSGATASTMPMTSPYRAPQPAPKPKYARRKPAGPFVVAVALGLILLSMAAAFVLSGTDLGSAIRVWTFWSAGVCIALGLLIVVLGLTGRRSGGLVPIAWIAAIVAVCMIGLNLTYSYLIHQYPAYAYQQGYERIAVRGTRTIQYSQSQPLPLDDERGLVIEGNDYDSDNLTLDLTEYASGGAHHIRLGDGSMVYSQCPNGQLNLGVNDARVTIILPENCTYWFAGQGSESSSSSTIGGQWSMILGGDVIGFDNDRNFAYGNGRYYSCFAGQTVETGCEWMNDWDKQPVDGPELVINPVAMLSGRVTVQYERGVDGYSQ